MVLRFGFGGSFDFVGGGGGGVVRFRRGVGRARLGRALGARRARSLLLLLLAGDRGQMQRRQ